jgi:hypothetical protein
MSEPTITFTVTSSEMVEVVKKWKITVPRGGAACPESRAYEIAEDRDPDEKYEVPCIEAGTEWSIEEIDKPDEWGNEPGSPMYGVPPEGDPFWKENEQ